MKITTPSIEISISAILIATTLLLSATNNTWAQNPNESSSQMATTQGPIDIQANEQDFGENEVIARGNVRVKYKDSTVIAPVATLYRDAGGNPQKAVFTGHPKLIQGDSKIEAETLTFEIANQKIVAEGNAHSEVTSSNDADAANKKSSNGGEKIITDSDKQEYDRSSQKFEAIGNVRVKHGDILVHSDKLKLVYGTNGKPETALFTGSVLAKQNKNSTYADTMTYSLSTKRLQATGHVCSKVIQEKKKSTPRKKVDNSGVGKDDLLPSAIANNDIEEIEEETITVISDAQDYSRETGRVNAVGHAKVIYQDMVGNGPQVILDCNDEGKADKVIFPNRSQISQPGRRWIADTIVMTLADKKVLAQGNTKAFILKTPPKLVPPVSEPSRLAITRIERPQ
jgi:lipopolysaccharide transport protein LptA